MSEPTRPPHRSALSRGRSLVWFSCAVLGSTLLACNPGPNKRDLYMEGLQIEGEAERGPCKIHYVEGQDAAPLSGDQLASCLHRTKEALAKYDEAAKLGLDDLDFKRVHERARESVAKLDGMIEQVRRMERGEE
ncbi:MAG: hypothetical protein K0V04_14680 [Deltaproteobacteria bacterium]|nr:hypothetical protein [Deltaproteobacteria bacterium]